MAAHRRHKKGAHDDHGGDHPDERWLLTYADMITLLMCLFMVLFSISSVNTSKFEALQLSLQDAFSGKILPGGKAIQQTGATNDTATRPSPEPPIPTIQPVSKQEMTQQSAAEKGEDEDFKKLKRQIDDYAKTHGLQRKLETEVARRGLVIRLLTDKLLFDSGSAVLKGLSTPLLANLSAVLTAEVVHPITVEGHTDSRPIATGAYPSNWELSTGRASSVVRFLIHHRVAPRRLTAAGQAALHPIAPNSTEIGRGRNRRVEIVLMRLNKVRGGGPAS